MFFFFLSLCCRWYVFIWHNAVLSSIVVLMLAFTLHDLRWQVHASLLSFLHFTTKYSDLKRQWPYKLFLTINKHTPFIVCAVLHYFGPLCPLRMRRWSTIHQTIYSNLSLIKISAELWSPYWCSVLKWSSSSGKNWKPFHLRGLKGSKEHQITLPVVFLFFSPQKLVTNCTFVGRGPCQAGAGGDCPRVQALETLSVSKWGLLYFTLWP